MQSQVYLAADK
jgi:hypothetical protein